MVELLMEMVLLQALVRQIILYQHQQMVAMEQLLLLSNNTTDCKFILF
jgi:hypothetical protein